ncbi:hypothetical protein AAIA72_12875 [Hahella sp. SMD15-11]|uniref:ATP-grasp domain-containing protein n=1 Tax=Thermohahella caldifontis TaxID=3142973 RepID=A0AB39UTS3_9GAMM
MKLVSFDPYRTLNLPGVRHVKPEQYLSALELIREADWVLFPEYWQLNTLIYGLRKRIFPSPASYHIGIDKIAQTRAFTAALPAHVPETLILGNTPENQKLAWDCMWLPFVAKLPRSSEGQGVFLIESEFDWQRYVRMTDVLYVQEYLPIDRDLRVVIVGDEVVTAYWRKGQSGFHNNVARGGEIIRTDIPEAGVELARTLARTFGIDHAGFDIAMVGNHPYVIEMNRLFGNTGIEQASRVLSDAMLRALRASDSCSGTGHPVPSEVPASAAPAVLNGHTDPPGLQHPLPTAVHTPR